jgi:hypothetical protein
LYRVDGARAAGLGVSGITEVGPDRVDVRAPTAGAHSLPVNWTRYWSVARGDACVSEGDDGETVIEALRPGPIELVITLGGDRC